MLDSRQKRKFHQILYNKVTIVVLAIVVLLTLRSTWIVYQKMRESRNLMDISLKNEKRLAQRNDNLKAQIEALGTSEGMEAEIRSKFNVAKDGENVVVVVNPSQTEPATTTEGFLARIWKFFGF